MGHRRGGSERMFLSEPSVTGTTPLDRRPRASETVTLYERSAALSKILGEVMRVYKMEADIIKALKDKGLLAIKSDAGIDVIFNKKKYRVPKNHYSG